MSEQKVPYITGGEIVQPTINVSMEKNSKSINYSITVINARDPEEAVALLREARERVEQELYGTTAVNLVPHNISDAEMNAAIEKALEKSR